MLKKIYFLFFILFFINNSIYSQAYKFEFNNCEKIVSLNHEYYCTTNPFKVDYDSSKGLSNVLNCSNKTYSRFDTIYYKDSLIKLDLKIRKLEIDSVKFLEKIKYFNCVYNDSLYLNNLIIYFKAVNEFKFEPIILQTTFIDKEEFYMSLNRESTIISVYENDQDLFMHISFVRFNGYSDDVGYSEAAFNFIKIGSKY